MQQHLAVHIDWIGSRAFLIRFLLFHIMYTHVWDIHCSVDDANFVECRNEWKKEKEHFFFFNSKDSKICGIYFYRTINIVFPSLLHTQFIYVDVYLSIFFKNKGLKRKILFYVFIFAHIFLNSLNELKYQWFSLLFSTILVEKYQESYQFSLLSCFIIANVEARVLD